MFPISSMPPTRENYRVIWLRAPYFSHWFPNVRPNPEPVQHVFHADVQDTGLEAENLVCEVVTILRDNHVGGFACLGRAGKKSGNLEK
jgi:hypothetical protein